MLKFVTFTILGALAFYQAYVSIIILRANEYEQKQKWLQVFIVWLAPLIGAMGCHFFLISQRRPGAVRSDLRDLEQVIYDVAEYKMDKDFHILYEFMSSRRVFVPIDTNTLPAGVVLGEKYVMNETDQLKMRTVTGPENLNLAPCATSENLTLLKAGCVGIDWVDFLEMFMKLDASFDGVLLQGKTSWVIFDRDRIKYILGLRTTNR